MCHDSVNHVFFQFPLCCLMKQVGGKIFIKLKEQAVKWATGASRGKHQDSSGSKSVESVEYENALNAKKNTPISERYLQFYLPNAVSTFRKLLILMLSLKRKMSH